ncbi:uncharacterized protein G2W53_009897 [Senna tora]|uniref:Uncharacterized protein n=1 Tax=Senna tora TaxID=362788 RepID=A0A834WZ56_9FABA|nr:uncharacterized protein G2W53_009897 [Senna tora]
MRSRCIANPRGSNTRVGIVIAWEVCQVMAEHILKGKARFNLNIIQVAQVRQTDAFALYWESERIQCSNETRDRMGVVSSHA